MVNCIYIHFIYIQYLLLPFMYNIKCRLFVRRSEFGPLARFLSLHPPSYLVSWFLLFNLTTLIFGPMRGDLDSDWSKNERSHFEVQITESTEASRLTEKK